MKRMLCYSLAVFAVLALTPCAFADSVVGSAGDGWQSWTSADLNNNGAPYWDNLSNDGTHYNIGNLLTGTQAGWGGAPVPAPSITSPPGAIQFWGASYNSATTGPGADTGGAADPSFYFTNPGGNQAALQIQIAGFAGSNTFGWYSIGSSGTLNPIFTNPSAGTTPTATFTPTTNYGFYFLTPDGTFYTQSSLNTVTMTSVSAGADVGNQQFALFETANGTYWLGMEDVPLSNGSDRDYNDMVVTIRPVPIPAAVWLLGSGLLGLAGIRRRFRK